MQFQVSSAELAAVHPQTAEAPQFGLLHLHNTSQDALHMTRISNHQSPNELRDDMLQVYILSPSEDIPLWHNKDINRE